MGVQDFIVGGLGFAGCDFAILGFQGSMPLFTPLGMTVLPCLRCALGQDIPSFVSPLAKAKEGADALLFYCFFLGCGLEWGMGVGQAEVGHGEIPERLIDLVKKNKGIQAPAPPCSTWACGIEAVTVKSCG